MEGDVRFLVLSVIWLLSLFWPTESPSELSLLLTQKTSLKTGTVPNGDSCRLIYYVCLPPYYNSFRHSHTPSFCHKNLCKLIKTFILFREISFNKRTTLIYGTKLTRKNYQMYLYFSGRSTRKRMSQTLFL